jgi:hypothetical protein
MRLIAALLVGAFVTIALVACAAPDPPADDASRARKELDRGGGSGGMM